MQNYLLFMEHLYGKQIVGGGKIYVIFYDDSKNLNMFSFCNQE